MLDHVHIVAPFQNEERERAFQKLKRHFNNLRFPGGCALYHTALVNAMMNRLLDNKGAREAFFVTDNIPEGLAEPLPSSVFELLQNAPNLRNAAKSLAEGREVTGYNLNKKMSLERLLAEVIDVRDYLTLLVHLGVAQVKSENQNHTFSITSACYRKNILEPLLKTLRASLQQLTSLTTTTDLYVQGEDILTDFVTSISARGMTRLMSWANSDPMHNVKELQFQSHVITEAFGILGDDVQTTQEDVLPTGKRTDVTFSSESCVVVLELKQTKDAPGSTFLNDAHEQLAGYIHTRRGMEAMSKKRPVAGFVVIMYENGAKYVVQKAQSIV